MCYLRNSEDIRMQLNDADRFIIGSSWTLGLLLSVYGKSRVAPMLTWEKLLREAPTRSGRG